VLLCELTSVVLLRVAGSGELQRTPHAGRPRLSDEGGNFSRTSRWYLLLGEAGKLGCSSFVSEILAQ